MTSANVLRHLIDALESLSVPYMFVGAISVNQYAWPRSTRDADIVVQLAPAQLGELTRRLSPHALLDRQLTFETATGTRRNIIRVPGSDYRIELFHLSEDAHDQSRFARRKRGECEGRTVWVPLAEDVIIWKLRWVVSAQRGKDRDDVQSVIAVQGPRLDWPYIHRWCEVHGTRGVLDEIVASIPPDLLLGDPAD